MEIFNQSSKTTPKDFFLYLGMIVTLYASTGSLIKLLFDTINALYPDRLEGFYYDPYSGGLRLAIASLIIIFPVYLLITNYLEKQVRLNEEKKNLWIRKWLIYLTLFLAGAIIIGDLIALINTFLNGEITLRFVLKILAVLLVTGGVFGGYGYILKKEKPDRKIISLFLIGSILVVLVSIGLGFLITGSPLTARKIRFDNQRLSDLQNIQWQIVNYWQNKRVLPPNLGALSDSISGFVPPHDPTTDELYGYEIISPMTFKLCAVFELPTPDNLRSNVISGEFSTAFRPVDKGNPSLPNMDNWTHQVGENCFERTIDPDFYPPRD